ncbi:hypothetical protein ColLi_06142 [Colletotrichum liriopes]|uniref:Geranylgeranyl pyrophosphate synthetase n=1 Tax=Colletotrichum liriopes TaxID=708192 RepID=A0AA37LSJ0_9PEZI|nr:hypothetical protein ColLi_06142 [Colletotrichum liriopes]
MKTEAPSAAIQTGPGPTKRRSALAKVPQQAWLWKQVRRPIEPVHAIVQTAIVPSAKEVSSKAGCQLDVVLPLALPPDRGTYFVDQNTDLVLQHPFEPMFRAAASMSQGMSFDDIDIVTNRNSLRKLLEFCAVRSQESFRLNLHLVRNTLIIERCEKRTHELIDGSRNSGWGRNYEKASAKFPLGLENSTGHHRTLRYSLGALRCAVQFEVDASYDPDGEGAAHPDTLALPMEQLSIQGAQPGEARAPPNGLQVETAYVEARVMRQSTAAEIKSTTNRKAPSQCMPQLWFGRTPWLIVGHHTEGTFDKTKVTYAAAKFADWEAAHQTALRKLVTVLVELRDAVRKNGGRHSAAVFERGSGAIRTLGLTSDRQALPADLQQEFWT